MPVLRFYFKPFVLISLINLFFFIILGTYFDTYEGIIDAVLQSIYSASITNWWDSNIHFVILYIYEYLILIFPDYNIYAIVLVVYNLFSITLLGLVLYRIMFVNLSVKNLLFFVMLYCILSADNFLNINSTRQSFLFTAAVIGLFESYKFEKKKFSTLFWICSIAVMLLACMIRFESVFLFSIIYVLLLLIYRRFTYSALLPLFISGVFLFLFNFLLATYALESKKVFAFKEKEIILRNNIDYGRLTKNQLMQVQLLKNYLIADENQFKIAYYDTIQKNKSSVGLLSIFDGVRPSYFANVFKMSLPDYIASKYFMLFYFLSWLLLFLKNIFRKKHYFIHFFVLSLLPVLLCLHSVVQLRFLIPYFTIAGCFNILLYTFQLQLKVKTYIFTFSLFLILMKNTYNNKDTYRDLNQKFIKTSEVLSKIADKQKVPVILYINFPNNYFPVKPTLRIKKQNALLFNFYLLGADEQYVKGWTKACDCNPLSLKSKIDYMVHTGNLFIIDENTYTFLSKYMHVFYNVELRKVNLAMFGSSSIVCKLYYK